MTSYHQRIHDYMIGSKQWVWIQKMLAGRGHVPLQEKTISIATQYGNEFVAKLQNSPSKYRNLLLCQRMLNDPTLLALIEDETGHPYSITWQENLVTDDLIDNYACLQHFIFVVANMPTVAKEIISKNLPLDK